MNAATAFAARGRDNPMRCTSARAAAPLPAAPESRAGTLVPSVAALRLRCLHQGPKPKVPCFVGGPCQTRTFGIISPTDELGPKRNGH
jgi:hypothetical protein